MSVEAPRLKALPLGETERIRRLVVEHGGMRWVPLQELFRGIVDRSLKLCLCGHPDCIEGGGKARRAYAGT